MRKSFIIAILALTLLIMVAGCEKAAPVPPSQKSYLKTEPIDLSNISTEKLEFVKYYGLDPLNIEIKVSQYELPLETRDITNYAAFSNKINLVENKALLEKNGFVVVKNPFNPKEEDITSPYNTLKDEEIPIFITADSLLHLYHIQFDETLRQIEERQFYDYIWDISKNLLDESENEYKNSKGDNKEAIKKNVAYLSVALSLLEPKEEQVCMERYGCSDDGLFTKEEYEKYNFSVPEYVKKDVEQELALIGEHKGFEDSPLFIYKEDYSQYVPRGHYTRSEKLKNYFKGVMWYGRLAFLLKGGKPYGPAATYLVSEEEAKIQTMSAVLIASKFAENKDLMVKWGRIYGVTAFYVGLSDDLGPYEYLEAMNSVFGSSFKADDLTKDNILKLKAELSKMRSPEIYGGTGGCKKIIDPGDELKPEFVDECLDKSKGFRLMGQRFIPDSYMFSNIVSPNVGKINDENQIPFTACYIEDYGWMRCFPKGLDVMALLGSAEARNILKNDKDDNYKGYEDRFNNLSAEFDSFTVKEWNKNLYWSWLYSLKALLNTYGEGYPSFMQTEAWNRKALHSGLASWAELRHDTILYAKQSYTMEITTDSVRPYVPPPPEKPVVGYVEPVPEFYNRLLALTRMTNKGLNEMEVLDESAKSRLNRLEGILQRLVNLSATELKNEELTKEDYGFIKNFGAELNGVIADVQDKAKKTTIIADVHTDQNTKQVLEEGLGYVDLIVVAYKVPDGRILIGAGPVMTYYEFKHPMEDRLTDEKWREMLGNGEAPKQPEWVGSFKS